MIETNDVGNYQILKLVESLGRRAWSDWQKEFISSLIGKNYETLTVRQKAVITQLYEGMAYSKNA